MIGKARLHGLVFVATAIAITMWLSFNFMANLTARGMTIDFGFLTAPTSFPIGESLISYQSGDTYLRALAAGLLNTIHLAMSSIVVATVIGVMVGLVARIGHPLLTSVAKTYVEFTRNVPLLLILVVCATAARSLPAPRQAWMVTDGILLSSRGLYLPSPIFENGMMKLAIGSVLVGVTGLVIRWALYDRTRFGKLTGAIKLGLTACALAFLVFCIWTAGTTSIDWPTLTGFNFRGGFSVTPEYLAMMFGLGFYTSGFIAEIVRGSLAAIPKGQSEATASLGLSSFLSLWLVLAPQAVRLMLPPLANQYLNLIKNTTLAVLIGFPDLVSVGNTALNQTGRAIETVSIYLLIYLLLSLVTSAIIRWLERRAQMVKL